MNISAVADASTEGAAMWLEKVLAILIVLALVMFALIVGAIKPKRFK